MAVVLVATTSLIGVSASQAGSSAKQRMFQTFERAPLTELAPLLDETTESLVAKLQSGGFEVDGPAQSVAEIALNNGTRPPELMPFLFE